MGRSRPPRAGTGVHARQRPYAHLRFQDRRSWFRAGCNNEDQVVIKDYRIRAFEPGDLPALHEIRAAAFKPVFQSFRDIVGEEIGSIAFANAEREQAELLDRICADRASYDVFVAERGSDIVAFCAVAMDRQSKIGEIELNAVHPDFQGKGIGTLMYEIALDRMREAGMRIATVGTGGDPSHAPARKALEKSGFGPAIPGVYLYRSL